ncbi:hypothetical protein ZWY2020_030987, partial [Hordeum vulgare]
VVLDGDPDKPVPVAGAKWRSRGYGALGEVEIVAVKGKIACKDFPHSRHSCSNLRCPSTSLLTRSNADGKYSSKQFSLPCYCFVCDAPAPCKYWGKGLLNDDHCHGTDKETKWKTLRQTFKCKSVPASYPEEGPNVEYYEEYTPEGYSEPDEEATTCIGNLPYDIDKKDRALLFMDVGIVVSFMRGEHARAVDMGVTMSTAEEAKKTMDYIPATGAARTEETPFPHPCRSVSSSFKIYVDNLPGKEAGRSPFGFVTMATRQEPENAIWYLNKQVWWGRKLRVRVAREEGTR